MDKILKLILLSLICIISSVRSDCSTPLECYTEAIRNLNEDRAEIRNFKDNIQAVIKAKIDEIKNYFEKKYKERELYWDKKNEDLQKSFVTQFEEMKKQIAGLQTEVTELKKVVAAITTYNKKNNNMYIESVIYDNLTQALEQGIIKKVGNPVGWNDTSYKTNPWNGKFMINIGTGAQSNGNGLQVNIPEGHNVLWIRCSNHVWGTFRLKYSDGNNEDLGKFACGYRNLNEISPDGGTPDTNQSTHIWTPMRVTRPGALIIYSDISSDDWISGIAFGKNLWNHARNSAIAYHWKLNGGTDGWNDNWNNDNLGLVVNRRLNEFFVPVVPSLKDKLLYIIEHNNNWLGTMHTDIKVNGTPIERFRTTYNNPFAVHFNSKFYTRYLAALIPNSLIPKEATFIKVEIDMRQQDANINYREMGTHDLE